MNIFKLLLYQLYLLQLENYNLRRYWKGYWRKVRNKLYISQRQQIVWTKKIRLIFALSLGLAFLCALTYLSNFHNVYVKILIVIGMWLILVNLLAPIFLSLAVLLLWPFDAVAKTFIVSLAKQKISTFKNLKIIGITGSFGKTTMKECLYPILSQKFKVLKTPENINTPLGISRLILSSLTSDIEIFIVEMGAFQPGDIQALCEIAKPEIVILTGINEAHLERFGSIENTIVTKFEIVANSKPDALVILNQENQLVKQNYQKYIANRKIAWYSSEKLNLGKIEIKLLGSFMTGVINACVIVAEELGMTESEISAGISKIKPIPHRLELVPSANGVTVIDDSYNGNPDGAAEAIKVLGSFTGKRKIYLTPGLVEMGSESEQIHRKIGQQLATVADMVILIKNSTTPLIAKELPKEKVIWFDTAPQAHAALKNLLKPGDVILFQNDWPDNYV